MRYIDTHFHILEMINKGIDIDALFSTLLSDGFVLGMDIAVDADDFEKRLVFTQKYPYLKFSVGVGPWGTDEGRPSIDSQVLTIENLIKKYKDKISFIGEIGLDNHYEGGCKKAQEELFIKQMELADKYNLPLSIHTREAIDQTIRIIKSHKVNRGGIIHCFSANECLLKIALDCGYYISFACPITYKSSIHLRSIVHKVPLDRLLVETDSPYLPPQNLRGKVNTPLNVKSVYETISKELNISLDELSDKVLSNFNKLCSIEKV